MHEFAYLSIGALRTESGSTPYAASQYNPRDLRLDTMLNRQLQRKIGLPGSHGQYGVICGCRPIWSKSNSAHDQIPRTIKKTDLILAGRSKAQMIEAIAAAVDKKELPAMETGAMCYMLSKQTYNDRNGHWHPHLMFFVSQADPAAWGAGMPGSPIFAFYDTWEHLTTFLVPVRQWSDGTPDL